MKQKFINLFRENFKKSLFSKMTISSVIKSEAIDDLKSIHIKPFESKNGRILSWVYRHQRKDITKNYTLEESVKLLDELVGNVFSQADMYCVGSDYFLKTDGKEKLTVKENASVKDVSGLHNKEKNRMVPESEEFLKLLGVSSADGYLRKDKKDKYIQINKFLEFFSVATGSLRKENISVLDMGSGKGYLTFAVYDFVHKNFGTGSSVTGVEFRPDMVELCNSLANKAGFEGLGFEQGTIADYDFENNDVLIALHACDTATDEALFKGISAGSKVIMVSPCCHKQVRKSMNTEGLAASFTKFGIMKERTAEMLTDLIRASILEIYGYQTNIFEFVNSDHTPKNLMITAVKKREAAASNPDSWKEVEDLKRQFGISYHHLQKMLGY
jgi:SAM-dependent methyltransferase